MTRTKLTFDEKQERRKKKRWAAIAAKPILGMATYDLNIVSYRLQITTLQKRSVTMRTINGKGTLTVSTTNGQLIEDFMKIEHLPCDVTPSVTFEGKTKKILQGSDVPM
jgi:hypothetical protein